MSIRSGLYSRQVLVAGMVGTSGLSEERSESALRDLGKKWQTRKLTHWDAFTTTHDRATVTGDVPPDFTKGEHAVRIPDAMEDDVFDRALAAFGRHP